MTGAAGKPVPPATVSLVNSVARAIVVRELRESTVDSLTIPDAVDYLVRQCLVLLLPHGHWARAEALVPVDKLHDLVVATVRSELARASVPEGMPTKGMP